MRYIAMEAVRSQARKGRSSRFVSFLEPAMSSFATLLPRFALRSSPSSLPPRHNRPTSVSAVLRSSCEFGEAHRRVEARELTSPPSLLLPFSLLLLRLSLGRYTRRRRPSFYLLGQPSSRRRTRSTCLHPQLAFLHPVLVRHSPRPFTSLLLKISKDYTYRPPSSSRPERVPLRPRRPPPAFQRPRSPPEASRTLCPPRLPHPVLPRPAPRQRRSLETDGLALSLRTRSRPHLPP